jgi:heme exporter protein B
MIFLRHVLTVAKKDLRSEFRTKEAINSSFSFALVILLLFSFAFDPTEEMTREFSGGLLWIAFAFAGALLLNRSFVRELPNDCLDALIASPVPAAALFLGKSLANLLLLLLVEAVSFPVFGVFYNQRWTRQFWPLLLVAILGTWGFTVVGTMFSALTVNIRLREVMLPLLVYTTLIPCLMASMQLTTLLLAGEPLTSVEGLVWLRFLIAFDVIFTTLAVVFVETVFIG